MSNAENEPERSEESQKATSKKFQTNFHLNSAHLERVLLYFQVVFDFFALGEYLSIPVGLYHVESSALSEFILCCVLDSLYYKENQNYLLQMRF